MFMLLCYDVEEEIIRSLSAKIAENIISPGGFPLG